MCHLTNTAIELWTFDWSGDLIYVYIHCFCPAFALQVIYYMYYLLSTLRTLHFFWLQDNNQVIDQFVRASRSACSWSWLVPGWLQPWDSIKLLLLVTHLHFSIIFKYLAGCWTLTLMHYFCLTNMMNRTGPRTVLSDATSDWGEVESCASQHHWLDHHFLPLAGRECSNIFQQSTTHSQVM